MTHKPLAFLCIGLLALPASEAAFAQLVPPSAETGRILEDRFGGALPAPLSKTPLEQKRIQTAPDTVTPEGPAFRLESLEFQGATVYTQSLLQDKFKERLGRDITVPELQQIASQVTDLYRNDGYILSSAIVPPQEVEGGKVVISVHEGGIASVVFDGLKPRHASATLLASVTKRLMLSQPLHKQVLEETLLLLNDIQGTQARAVFKPSPSEPNSIDLIIKFQRRESLNALSINNRSSNYVGPWQVAVGKTFYGTYNPFDAISFQYLTGTQNREFQGVQASYERPLNAWGTTVRAEWTRAWSSPGYTLRQLDLESLNQRFGVNVKQPLLRTRAENIYLSGGLGTRFSRTEFQDDLLSEDDYRIAEAKIAWDFSDPSGGVSLLDFGVTQGLPVFGEKESGRPLLSRRDGKTDFTRLSMFVSRSQGIRGPLSVYIAANGQYALSQLLAPEEFGYGGSTFGRGYDPSEITGDHGIAALAEFRYSLDTQGIKYVNGAQLFASYDFGSTWNIDSDNKGPQLTGASLSAGLRYSVTDYLTGSVELSKPLTRGVNAFADDSSKDPRFFTSLQVNF